MQQHTIFDTLHKGLQNLLSDTAHMLQKTDFASSSEPAATLLRLNRFLRLLQDEALLEETFLFPEIEKEAPATIFVLEQDHQDIKAAVQRLMALVKTYKQVSSSEEKLFTGSMIVNSFTGLMILMLRHFSREENMISNILSNRFSSTAIAMLEQEIRSCIAPEDLVLYNFHDSKNLSGESVTSWLHKLEAATGLQTFQELAIYAEQELMFMHITDPMQETALVA